MTDLLPARKLNLEVERMENVLGVEEARRVLGELVSDVSRKKEAVIITRRAKERAVLIGYEEYRRLKEVAAEAASARVAQALARIHEAVREAGVPPSAVEEAIREVRSR